MMVYHTTVEFPMAAEKIAVTLEKELVTRLDQLVAARQFPSRSRAVQQAIREKLERMDRTRLSNECAKLNPEFEQEMAELGMNADAKTWPEY
jgi:Arc/MetJ-type ribon-helix-helix transcriptional regulator